MINTGYTFADLLKIVKTLRSPNGCPWDKAQTHESIRKNFIEETYEAIDAIDKKDDELLCEELGDVLLQVVFHAQIAAEENRFTIDDVLKCLCHKLIIRHEHVFGENKATNAEDALNRWDDVKKKTKNEKTELERMQNIPQSLPALMRAEKIYSRAVKAGVSEIPDGLGRELFKFVAENENSEQILQNYNNLFIENFKNHLQ